MRAMVLEGEPRTLTLKTVGDPRHGLGQLLLRVEACGVCRRDLHVVDGDLVRPKLPLIPGHEIPARIRELSSDVLELAIGQPVGVPYPCRRRGVLSVKASCLKPESLGFPCC